MMKNLFHKLICLLLSVLSSMVPEAQTIALKINDKMIDTAYQDEPVIIYVSISNAGAQYAERWNLAGERRISELKKELDAGRLSQQAYDEEKRRIDSNKRYVEPIMIGDASAPWTESLHWVITEMKNEKTPLSLPLNFLPFPETTEKIVLDANSYIMAAFGISPGDLQKITAGIYDIRLKLNKAESNPVRLQIHSGSSPASLRTSIPELLQRGRYAWHTKDAVNTVRYANEILATDPNSIDGFSLQGDGLVLQGSYLPALESFNKALNEYNKQYGENAEPPEYLLGQISSLKKKLGEPDRAQ